MNRPVYPILSIFFGFIVNILFIVPAYSQQDAQVTQYMYNGMFYNPAFSGKEGGYRFSALHRSQWYNYSTTAGTGGEPNTQIMTVSGSLDRLNLGFGLVFVNDDIGATSNQEINLSVAYHYRIGRGVLSLGASGGVFSSTIRYDQLDPVNQDPLIPTSGRENQMNMNIAAGALYDRGNVYFGVSSRHLNEPVFDFGEGGFGNQLENHTYAIVGYRINTFTLFSVEPSVLLKSISLNNFSYDLSVIGTYNRKINLGLAYRGEESVSILMGYSLLRDNSLRLGYAFDLVWGGLEAKAPTGHEFLLTYNLPQIKREFEKVIQRTPRFRF